MNTLSRVRAWRSPLLASTILIPLLPFVVPAARAQQASTSQLPPVEVSPPPQDANQTRAKPTNNDGSGSPRTAPGAATTDNSTSTGDGASVRQFNGIVGTSATVITAQDIARSPSLTIQEIVGQVPGVQLTTLFGGVNGAQTNVGLRGFGAFATANTLVLINGRRINDVDLTGVDLSTIPRDSIERIEITRGNSGAVLYGDNAVGGVINIVTKVGAGAPFSASLEGAFGSFNQRQGAVSTASNQGAWSTSFFSNGVFSDGYRTNNSLAQQNAVGEIRYTKSDFTAFLNVSGDNQRLGLPGGRLVNPSAGINQLVTDRTGTDNPFDYADKQGANATAGFTKTLWNGVDLIVDGGVRDKKQQADFFSSFSYVDTTLQTWSLTPRLSIKNSIFGLPSTIITGIDFYDAFYHSNRSEAQGVAPLDVFDVNQKTLGFYWQHTIGILASTDVSYGGRAQQTSVTASDLLNPAAPGFFGENQISPLNSTEWNQAWHVGIEHRFNDVFSIFARAADAFRTPNVDERVGASPIFDPTFTIALPRSFDLKTQTSNDVEAGFRVKAGKFEMQTSFYNMNLTNEIHFDPVNFIDFNLDPTRRYGSETNAIYRVSDTLLLRGGFAYTRAVFREGPFTGNDIPLVSRYTANAGVSWNIWQKYVVADATVRYWSSRRMDNDQPNLQPLIPANATVDLKLSGAYDKYYWSLSVNNVFDVLYYDYAIASAFTPGEFSAFPLPGRTFMLKAGVAL